MNHAHRHTVEVSPTRPAGLIGFAKVRFRTEKEVQAFGRKLAKAFKRSRASLAAAIEQFVIDNPARFLRGELNEQDLIKLFEEPFAAAYMAGAAPIIEKAGREELRALGLSPSLFRLENPHTQRWLQNHGAELVTGVTKQTKAGIRVIVANLIKQGGGTGEVDFARQNLEALVGLSPRDVRAVMRRADTLTATGKYSSDRVHREVQKYADRLSEQRGMNIARTESIRANTAGTQTAWREAVDQGLLPPGLQRVWIAAVGYACPWCEELNGQTVGMEEPWVSPEYGRVQAPPAHPQCRCAVGLVQG